MMSHVRADASAPHQQVDSALGYYIMSLFDLCEGIREFKEQKMQTGEDVRLVHIGESLSIHDSG